MGTGRAAHIRLPLANVGTQSYPATFIFVLITFIAPQS